MSRNGTLIPTLRETPIDAAILFHKLLLCASVSWLLPALLLLAAPAAVKAQFGYMTNADGSIYTYSTNADGSATIAAYSGPPWAVTVPDTINGLPVTSIGIWAFGDTSLTSVTIGNSVTNIGIEAFYFCIGLTNAAIGNGVTNIGSAAFHSCYNLKNITIGNSLTSIGTEAFQGCTGLTNVTIGNDLTSIGDFAFYNCTSLINVTIGNGVTNTGVTSIGNEAFTYCTSLKKITIGNSVVSIGIWAFGNCTSLTGVTIPAGATNIGIEAFESCGLTSVFFEGNAPTSVGTNVFYGDPATVYHLPGTTGWSATFGGCVTALWNPQALTSDPSFGVRTNQFGFTIIGSSNLVIVVEACTNLANSSWIPVGTNTLNTLIGTNGTSYFGDPQWTNYPGRFYRLRSR